MSPPAAFMEYFGITRPLADTLAVLYKSKSGGVPMNRLAGSCGRNASTIARHLVAIRKAMDDGAVSSPAINYECAIYSLTASGRAECDKAIRECAGEAAA